MQQDSHPELAEKIERLFFSLVVMIVYPVVGSYGLSSAIVESKAVDGRGERRSFRIINEGERVGMRKHARSTIAA